MTQLPSGPPRSFPLGFIPTFFRDPLGYLMEVARTHGDVITLPVVPGYNVFLLNHPDVVREVLVEKAAQFHKLDQFKKVFAAAFGNGLFFSEGDFWRRQRRLMQPAFHHRQIENYGNIMVEHTTDVLGEWQPDQTRPIDADMHNLTLRIVVRSIFKADVGEQAAHFRATLDSLGRLLGQQTFSVNNVLPEWFPTPLLIRKRRLTREMDEIVYSFINEARAGGHGEDSLLATLMEAVDEETGERMDDKQLRDEVLTLFVAGHDTTARTMTWIWALLAQHPQVEAALHDELDRVLGGRPPTVADLASLPLTEQIVRETLRLYPIAWVNFREALQAMTIGGYRLPKKAQVWFVPYTIHRDPRYYDEPEQFRPERFAEGWEERIPKYAYFPFGGGPRVCLGNGFALLEARLILATVAQRFRLALPPGHKVEVDPIPILGVKGGLPMQVVARE